MKSVKALLIGLVFVVSMVAVAGAGGGHPGERIFYESRPSCAACHNLQYSRVPPNTIAYLVRNGIPGKMPAYRLTDRELDALIDYLLRIRR